MLHGSTPALYRAHLEETVASVSHKKPEERIVFLQSWNEWAESNYLEPDRRFGNAYLDATREAVAASAHEASVEAR